MFPYPLQEPHLKGCFMKFLLLIVFLYSGLTLAKSRIGEWAAYNYEESNPESTTKGTLIKEIIDEKRMRSPDGKLINYVLVSEKLNFESKTKSISNWIPESEFLTGIELNIFMLKCRSEERRVGKECRL